MVALLGKEGGEVGGRHISVVAADGVKHLHLVLDQLVCRDALRVLPVRDEAALDAVLHVGQLDAWEGSHAWMGDGPMLPTQVLTVSRPPVAALGCASGRSSAPGCARELPIGEPP